MAKAMVKCLICGESFDRNSEECTKVGRRYAHKLCHEKQESELNAEQKALKELEEYIMKMFKEDFVSARVRQQIKRMREQPYNYTYSGILKSLIYFFEIKGNSIEKANNGIGIVPYVYKDAYTYYHNLYLAQQKNKDKEIVDFVGTRVDVVIKAPKRKPKEIKLFDLGED